jgi:hypothetical protein
MSLNFGWGHGLGVGPSLGKLDFELELEHLSFSLPCLYSINEHLSYMLVEKQKLEL